MLSSEILFYLFPLGFAGLSYWVVRAGKGNISSLLLIPGVLAAVFVALALTALDRLSMNLIFFVSFLWCGLPSLAIVVFTTLLAFLMRKDTKVSFIRNFFVVVISLSAVALLSSTAFSLSEARATRVYCEGIVRDLEAYRLEHGSYPENVSTTIERPSRNRPLSLRLTPTTMESFCGYQRVDGHFEMFVHGLPLSGWEYSSLRKEWTFVSGPT